MVLRRHLCCAAMGDSAEDRGRWWRNGSPGALFAMWSFVRGKSAVAEFTVHRRSRPQHVLIQPTLVHLQCALTGDDGRSTHPW